MGEGTTFRVFLPRHIPVEKEEPDAASVVKKDAPRDLTGSATILLVEDEDAVRAFGSRALASRGYEVHEAVSGVEALEILEEYGDEIDLIVSDVVMPEMDGPTLLREVRKKHPDLKFIFVSGYAEEAFAKNLPEEERDRFGFLEAVLAQATRDDREGNAGQLTWHCGRCRWPGMTVAAVLEVFAGKGLGQNQRHPIRAKVDLRSEIHPCWGSTSHRLPEKSQAIRPKPDFSGLLNTFWFVFGASKGEFTAVSCRNDCIHIGGQYHEQERAYCSRGGLRRPHQSAGIGCS